MWLKRTAISKLSDKGRLRRAIGKVHLEVLRRERGDRCEICQIPGNVTRFHILPVGRYPKMEFVDENVLLAHWMNNCQGHYLWHHSGSDDPRNIRTMNRIKALRGEDYRARLIEQDKFMGVHNELYLLAVQDALKRRLI